jgi:hypothetical protein
MSGAQYLHEPIPGITGKSFNVNFVKLGKRDGYARNTYGNEHAPVSWDKWPAGLTPAWSLPSAYDLLWETYHNEIDDQWVTQDLIPELIAESSFVISTIPRTHLCSDPDGHGFFGQKVWIKDEAADRVRANQIVYNGLKRPTWYRSSLINGIGSTESRYEMEDSKPGVKPLGTSCKCHPELFYKGRFGSWSKNVLLHHVYNDVAAMARNYTHHNGSLHALQ